MWCSVAWWVVVGAAALAPGAEPPTALHSTARRGGPVFQTHIFKRTQVQRSTAQHSPGARAWLNVLPTVMPALSSSKTRLRTWGGARGSNATAHVSLNHSITPQRGGQRWLPCRRARLAVRAVPWLLMLHPRCRCRALGLAAGTCCCSAVERTLAPASKHVGTHCVDVDAGLLGAGAGAVELRVESSD